MRKHTSRCTDSILCLICILPRMGYFIGDTHLRYTDVLLVNQTSNTLQNLCLDFATLGDLKLVERPAVYTIAPHGFQSIKATIKVRAQDTLPLIHVYCAS